MDDISENAEAFFIIGSNTSEQHPVFGTMLRRAVRFRGAKLIVADPRKIDIVDFATLHLQHRTGTDIPLINGLMHIILKNGWEDKNFIAERTEDFDEFYETVMRYTPEKTYEITGVPIEKLQEAAEIMGAAKPMAVMWAMGITQHITGVHNVFSLANLQMLLGNMGVAGGGVNPLRGQNNVQGACDLGGLPNVYSGYQKVTDPANQAKFEAAWGVPLSPRLGKTATELVPGILKGTTSALYVLAENPVMSEPDTNHVRASFEQLDFLVLQEIFPTETAVYADVLLPGVSFAEKTGTFTNTERRVQMVQAAIPSLGESKQDWEIITQIAKRMIEKRNPNLDAPFVGWNYQNPAEIMDEVNALTPIYGGVTHARILAGERLQWPCTGPEHPGTKILHVGKFARGLGKFHAVDHVPPAEQPDEDYPFVMSTGRVLYHWHGGEMTRRTNGLSKVYGEAMVEINPEDAERMSVTDESYLNVTSRRGTIKARAWVTERVPEGMVYTNFHFPESSANILTQAVLDPIAKIPEYKVTAVKVEKVG